MAQDDSVSVASRLQAWLSRFVQVEAHEIRALLASFAMFFSLLAAYYIIRPLRDDMGITIGKDELHHLFTIVFFVMLAVVPIFGFIASTYPRRLVLPGIYAFFILNILGFWVLLRGGAPDVKIASAFFVWASVFNLIVISLFWSLMAELWSNTEAKRVYGFISAGGTAGALLGPLVATFLSRVFNPIDLLWIAAAFLLLALIMSLVFRGARPGNSAGASDPVGGGIFDGLKRVLESPYLARIAAFIFLANIVGTFFYLEQSRLVAQTFTDSASRVQFFAGRDLFVSIATLLIEIFGTAVVLRHFGVGVALMALPFNALIGTLAIAAKPLLAIVAIVMIAERVVAFSLSGPAIKILYTLCPPDEKYKVQNFIDTVVYRGGDAAAGWLFALIGGGLGFAVAATPLIAAPLAGLWLLTARDLGKAHDDKLKITSETDHAVR